MRPSIAATSLCILTATCRGSAAFSPNRPDRPSQRIGQQRERRGRIRPLHSTTERGADVQTIEADEARRRALAGKRESESPDDGKRRNQNDQEWKFFDTARCHVTAGPGGNGCVAFRREKGEAMGGPNGGRGGPGGSVYFVADEGLNTLALLRNRVHVRARGGKNGIGKNKDGSAGADVYVRVPCGTIVRELHTQKVAGELRTDGEVLMVAKGGRGGRGNAAFMTNRRTAPKLSERGEPGAERWLGVELRLVADVGEFVLDLTLSRFAIAPSFSDAREQVSSACPTPERAPS